MPTAKRVFSWEKGDQDQGIEASDRELKDDRRGTSVVVQSLRMQGTVV